MNFSTLVTEFAARGFSYFLDDAAGVIRAGYFINQSYQDICGRQDWPFLLTETTGTAPLTISDLRAVRNVTDSTQDTGLYPLDPRTVREIDPDLPTTGTPEAYFLDSESSSGVLLKVWPANTTDTLTVRYVKAPADLAGTDTPLIPARYHLAIVDGACLRAYSDTDNLDAYAALKTIYEEQISRMTWELLHRHKDQPEMVERVGVHEGLY